MKEIYKEVLKNTVLITGGFILLSLVGVFIIVTSVIGVSPILLGVYLIEECGYDKWIIILAFIFTFPWWAFVFTIADKIAKKIGLPFI